jgi:hypothetical protein
MWLPACIGVMNVKHGLAGCTVCVDKYGICVAPVGAACAVLCGPAGLCVVILSLGLLGVPVFTVCAHHGCCAPHYLVCSLLTLVDKQQLL